MVEASSFIPQSEALPPHERNIEAFTSEYAAQISKEAHLQNHIGTLSYVSNQLIVDAKTNGLRTFLNSYGVAHPIENTVYHQGRTTLKEIVLKTNTQDTYGPVLQDTDQSIRLTPTSIDNSNHVLGEEYQQGADLFSVDGQDGVWAMDLADDDVTLKRKNIGLQVPINMPVVVVSLRSLTYSVPDCPQKHNFNRYTDHEARESVIRYGDYLPFYGLEEEDVYIWKKELIKRVKEGIEKCRDKFLHPPQELGKYTNLNIALTRLNYLESLNDIAAIQI